MGMERIQGNIEALHEKYIRWLLQLDRETPGYLIRRETGREKLGVKAKENRFKEKIKKGWSNNEGMLEMDEEKHERKKLREEKRKTNEFRLKQERI